MEINPLRPSDAAAAVPAGGATGGAAVNFKDLLAEALGQVNQLQQAADAEVVRLAAGEAAIDDVMLAVQKADLALQLTVQIRNKLIEAYQDLSRMQI
jgi:flagellar hook-basal body complex protein FliE